jgi:hypothetical protein
MYNGAEFRHGSSSVTQQYFRFGFYDLSAPVKNTDDGFQFLPVGVFEVNGSEPTIEGLLRRITNQGDLANADTVNTTTIDDNSTSQSDSSSTTGSVVVTSDGLNSTTSMAVGDADMTTIATVTGFTPVVAPADGGSILIQANVSLDTWSLTADADAWFATIWIARKTGSTWTGLRAWSAADFFHPMYAGSTNYSRALGVYSVQYHDTSYSAATTYEYALRVGVSTSSGTDTMTFTRRDLSVIELKR